MVFALMPFLASAILISSPIPSLSQQTPTNASTSFVITPAGGPGHNIVAYMAKEGLIHTVQPPKPEKSNKTENQPKKQYAQPVQAEVVIYSPPQSSYDDTYKAAGAQYGVPWQILYGLHITETGGRNGPISSGYGTGAQGPMQFMPGTWRAYGVDGDGDGQADINNAVDAIHGAANYLAKHGSLDAGLRAYGGNYSGTLALAQTKGYTP